ncbi:MAG TPA: Rho termination factor N-terminal domain-containing protein, partial [Cytophagaceae bacterium]
MTNDNENHRSPFWELTVDELYKIATEKGIPSLNPSMTKEELIEVLENYRASGEHKEISSDPPQFSAGPGS